MNSCVLWRRRRNLTTDDDDDDDYEHDDGDLFSRTPFELALVYW